MERAAFLQTEKIQVQCNVSMAAYSTTGRFAKILNQKYIAKSRPGCLYKWHEQLSIFILAGTGGHTMPAVGLP